MGLGVGRDRRGNGVSDVEDATVGIVATRNPFDLRWEHFSFSLIVRVTMTAAAFGIVGDVRSSAGMCRRIGA